LPRAGTALMPTPFGL